MAEWTGRPAEALEQWRVLARRGGGEEAWDALLRLAPGLFDDDAFLEALEHRLGRGVPDRRSVTELVTLYERTGEPLAGLRSLERLYRRQPSPWLLESMAVLAQRAGEDRLAMDLWRRLESTAGLTPAQAMQAAGLCARPGPAGRGLRPAAGRKGLGP